MIIRFSRNRFQQIGGVIRFNFKGIAIFLFIDILVYALYAFFNIDLHVPAVPVSILGGALAIFLGFRNNSAYDRWWEARKIWGGIVNVSRSFTAEVLAIVSDKRQQKQLVYRHIAWINALRLQLRKQNDFSDLTPFINDNEAKLLPEWKNKATQLINLQISEIGKEKKQGKLSDIEQQQLMSSLKLMYDYQGKAERIKNTVFPYYYVYFTHLFLWTFVLLLPCILVKEMGWLSIPMATMISFVFYILDKTGLVTEDPFENRAADTPMSALCRTIEIDLRQMLGETDLPNPIGPQQTGVAVEYLP